MLASGGAGAYPADLRKQLDDWLAKASEECPGKPIFVFTHVPPQWTVYGSWPEYENGSSWGMSDLNSVLNKYPQAVVFAGHSHYPLGDPRSIHQGANPDSPRKNFYTVINTASTTYGELHPGAVNAGIHPEGYAYSTEGMILTELENGDIEIRRFDTYRNTEIHPEERWVLKAPFDGSQFQYADIRDRDDNPEGRPLRDGLPAPAWESGEGLSAKAGAYWAEVTIPPEGWYETMAGWPTLFADFNTTDGKGNTVDLSKRISRYYTVDQNTNDTTWCVAKNHLTAEEAARYTAERVMGGEDHWNPAAQCRQLPAVKAARKGGQLQWKPVEGARGYLVFRNGAFYNSTTQTTMAVEKGGKYTVKAVSPWGTIGQ